MVTLMVRIARMLEEILSVVDTLAFYDVVTAQRPRITSVVTKTWEFAGNDRMKIMRANDETRPRKIVNLRQLPIAPVLKNVG